MATVYRAYQPSLHRYVAIKVLPPQLTFDPEFVERFQREARAAAGLRHPNIVVIHDVAQENVGGVATHYIVMEYLEGQTLGDLIARQGALPPERALRIVEQVGAALDYAHQRGFVHRDVKPNNIFVGEGDRVTLTDFGIAKAASEAQQLTRTGAIMGTPEYMSPEQAEGEQIDHRTDIYALGVVLYQMLVGRVPFRGTTPHAVLHDVIYEAPPPPRRINPAITPAVEAAVMKSIAKQPNQRFQRGAHLTRALREAMAQGAGGAVRVPGAVPPGVGLAPATPAGAAAGSSRLPWILGGAALVLFLIIAGLLLAIAAGRDGDTPTPAPTFTLGVALVSETPPATATLAGGADTPAPTGVEATPTVPPDTAAPATEIPTPTTEPPTGTPSPTAEPPTDTPTPTPEPPTNTPTSTPTPTCSLAVDAELAGAWSRDRLGCPTAGASITWAAWEPFERGQMVWRQDVDRVFVLVRTSSSPVGGNWQAILDDWDGSNPEGVGMSPPPGLYEPKRGFGWVWRNFFGGPTGSLGWATDEEKGFCAKVQPFERGTLLHSNTVEFCEDALFNWARDPSFSPLFLALYDDGRWQKH